VKTPRRVLIVQPYGIGDLLFLTPVLRALRLITTVERVDLLLGSRSRTVVEHNPHVDSVEVIDKDLFHSRSLAGNSAALLKLGRQLKQRHYDLLIDYSLRPEYGFLGLFFLGIRRRAGFAYKSRDCFHNIRLDVREGFCGRHMVDYYCDLAERAGVRVRDRWLEFYFPDSVRDEARSWLRSQSKAAWKRYLVLSPGGGASWGKDADMKQWPPQYFADLTARLVRFLEADGAVVLGSVAEAGLGEQIRDLSKIPILNAAGALSLAQAAALMDEALVFLGNDGGLLHLASARGLPLVGFYGPVDPSVYGPYAAGPGQTAVFRSGLACRPCYRKFRYATGCAHRRCLRDLTPDEVMRHLRENAFFSSISPFPKTSPNGSSTRKGVQGDDSSLDSFCGGHDSDDGDGH